MRPNEPGERTLPAPETGPGVVAHEPSDVETRPIVWFAVGLLISALVISVGLWGLLRLFARQSRGAQTRLPPNVATNLRRTPVEPRLEPLPLELRLRLRAREDAILSNYGWVDRGAGIARIPIDEAMRRIAQRGVPGGKPLAAGVMAPAPGTGGAEAAGRRRVTVATPGARE